MAPFGSFPHLTIISIIWLIHTCFVVVGQFQQDYTIQRVHLPGGGSTEHYYYRPTVNDALSEVVDLAPESVYLVYNCFYMTDICRNVFNFEQTLRGRSPHPHSGLPQYVYGYDLSTGRGPASRSRRRRGRSCPTGILGWKFRHPCPEVDQRTVMRPDGPWFTTALEPGTKINNLMNRRDMLGKIVQYSKVRYSCDEFPPATWVEGGDGEGGDGPSATRCAAMRCGPGVKAEQDWQATAHGRLRDVLLRVTDAQRIAQGRFPSFDIRNNVILFGFIRNNQPDGIAARVWAYPDPANNPNNNGPSEVIVTQARKYIDGEAVNVTARTHRWPAVADFEDLERRIKLGHGTEFVVHANDPVLPLNDISSSAIEAPIMDSMGMQYTWNITADEVTTRPRSNLSRNSTTRDQPLLNCTLDRQITPLLRQASVKDLQDARKIVQNAMVESSKLNAARLANPLRNKYGLGFRNSADTKSIPAVRATGDEKANPLLHITDEIAHAAALVAEADASAMAEGNVTKRIVTSSGTYWMESLTRKGSVPWGNDPGYKVFRNVLEYGARGDGITDDTKAIKSAMNTGSRCGEKCNGSTTKNAIVYFPPGKYLVSSTIAMPFGTQVIGDANDRPTLIASKSFIGLGVLSTDEYTGQGIGIDGLDQEYFVNTANFYRQIRNIIIDIRQVASSSKEIACLHYQVAQATSLQNVDLVAGPTHIGMYAENGSGGQISDVNFVGGLIGLFGGNQQFTAQRLKFSGCGTGVQVIWDWGWVWKSVTMTNVNVGFKLLSNDGKGNIGSVSILDSSFADVRTAVLIAPPSPKVASGSTGVVLENVTLSGVTSAVADTDGKIHLSGSAAVVDQWALGPIYEGSATARSFSQGRKVGKHRRHSTLVNSKGEYFERPRPQYENRGVGEFLHVKDMGATGDGATDDTAAFQAALYASLGKVLFIDAGSYILTSTVTIPLGSKIVGETWSQLVASGPYFGDASNPKVLLKVGNVGDVGDVEMQDLLFTTRGPTAGAVVVQWNIRASNAGSAALWDCHVRIGGASGTRLTPDECPPLTNGINPGCSAASLMMHVTSSASGYFENMWLWGADHMIDDPLLEDGNNTMVKTSVYVARGLLIESRNPTWLYGTASEHAVFYQYNFHKAANIFAGMVQTESPYFQPNPPPPAPFSGAVGKFVGDPVYKCTTSNEFSGCDESWGLIIRQSENIFIASAGIYSWFSNYTQSCVDPQSCQKVLLLLDSNFAGVRIQNLITIGAKYMAVMNGKAIVAKDNLSVNKHPFWSHVSILDVSSNGSQSNEHIWVDPVIWRMDQPKFTCSPPCKVKIPPWTGATSTVNYPLLTVSDGTWTSTITHPPLTISLWVFEAATLTQMSGKAKRAEFTELWPVAGTTPYWPNVTFTGHNWLTSSTASTKPFPTPPPIVRPGAPAPPKGNWPKGPVHVYFGQLEQPLVSECFFPDFNCFNNNPWDFGMNISDTYFGDPGNPDENEEELRTLCPISTSTTTTSQPAPTKSPEPVRVQGDPMLNKVRCYNSGENTEHERMTNAAGSFCRDLERDGDILPPRYFHERRLSFPYNRGIGTVDIIVSLEIKLDCEWKYSLNDCQRYLKVPVDSCNCRGVDWKQGGVVENNCYKWRIDPELKL